MPETVSCASPGCPGIQAILSRPLGQNSPCLPLTRYHPPIFWFLVAMPKIFSSSLLGNRHVYMYIRVYYAYMCIYTYIPYHTMPYHTKAYHTGITLHYIALSYMTFHYTTYLPTYIHTYIHACIHTYIQTYIQTYLHTYKHTYIHTYIHTHIFQYIYIYYSLIIDFGRLKVGEAWLVAPPGSPVGSCGTMRTRWAFWLRAWGMHGSWMETS
jgi:hypothetical protein